MLEKVGPKRIVLRTGLILLAVIVIGGTGWWAGRATLGDAQVEQPEPTEPVWGTAARASVGRSLPLSTTVRQPFRPIAVNGLDGIVTTVNPGERAQGEVVYTVGEVPVRLVQAPQPFHRSLSNGSSGVDVTALQQLLAHLGHFSGEADGIFGQSTTAAVQAWQKSESRPTTGIVELGELIAVAVLPTTVTLGQDIRVGNRVEGGEDAVLAPSGERDFVLVVNSSQAELIPQDSAVEITFEELRWQASIGEVRLTPESQTEFLLIGTGGAPVCGEECSQLPAAEELVLRSQVVVVPPVEGIGVPVAAVRTRPDGSSLVETDNGSLEVAVRGSGQGIAIVDGVPEGTRVKLSDEGER